MADPSRWLNEHFVGWRNLTTQEKKAIRDFPVLWSIFELRATGQNGVRANATPQRICEAVENLDVNLDFEVLRQARDYFSTRYFNDSNPTDACRQLRIDPDFQANVRTALLDENAQVQSVLLGLLLIANRLRNNFLHGDKVVYSFANQLGNFRHANNVLMYAIPLWREP